MIIFAPIITDVRYEDVFLFYEYLEKRVVKCPARQAFLWSESHIDHLETLLTVQNPICPVTTQLCVGVAVGMDRFVLLYTHTLIQKNNRNCLSYNINVSVYLLTSATIAIFYLNYRN